MTPVRMLIRVRAEGGCGAEGGELRLTFIALVAFEGQNISALSCPAEAR